MFENIKAVVIEAGKIMLGANQISQSVESKEGRANFVTKYDVEVQNFLYEKLKKLYPEADFIGEEDEKKRINHAEICFVIDPIDGTTNFIFDYRHSAISVGVLYRGQIYAGVVYNPYLEELFYAEKEKGAYLNDRQLKLTDLSISEGIVGFGSCPYDRTKTEKTFRLAQKLFDHALDIRRSGSAALDICYVAAGRFVLFYELMLQPWDYAAASLILMEAGGRISTMDQQELTYITPCPVVAATPKAYQDYTDLIS